MNMTERMEAIKAKFLKLKASDPKFKLDGAKEHEYILGDPLTEEQVATYEKKNGLRLPEDFRWALINMGSQGPIGPSCYYLLELDEPVDGEFPLKYGQMYSMDKFEEEYEDNDDGWKAIGIASEKASKGHICMGDDGYAEICMVLKGAAAGTIWSVHFGTDSYGAFPYSSPYREDEPMTFADMLENWIDMALEGNSPKYDDYIDDGSLTHVSIPQEEFDAYEDDDNHDESKNEEI